MSIRRSLFNQSRDQEQGPNSPRREPEFRDQSSIEHLLESLQDRDPHVREVARTGLLRYGKAAIKPLIELLSSADPHTRWEAAKTLVELRRAEAAEALVASLIDTSRDVRWLAAEGLIAIGSPALGPLLHGLISHAESVWMRKGGAAVLHALGNEENFEIVAPVLRALEDGAPLVAVPVAAHESLDRLRSLREKEFRRKRG